MLRAQRMDCRGIQIMGSRSYCSTLGLKVGITYVLGAVGYHPSTATRRAPRPKNEIVLQYI